MTWKKMVQSLLNTAEETKRMINIIGGMSMMQSLVIIHPFHLLAGWKFSEPHITCFTWKQHLKRNSARLTRLKERLYVTTPSKIIPYYRLNHSIWSLSDNRETSHWVLSGLHPVNHLETQRGSNVCIKLPWKRVQSALQINIKSL
jgi:hypothetical protein